ncbi:MAG: T9SS type A sorting domain-containing protein [Segetibacter sp.]
MEKRFRAVFPLCLLAALQHSGLKFITIRLSSIEGKGLKQEKLQTTSVKYAQQQFNVNDITSGIYLFVIIYEKGNRKTEKVIVAR